MTSVLCDVKDEVLKTLFDRDGEMEEEVDENQVVKKESESLQSGRI
jgi:hypothetical protein